MAIAAINYFNNDATNPLGKVFIYERNDMGLYVVRDTITQSANYRDQSIQFGTKVKNFARRKHARRWRRELGNAPKRGRDIHVVVRKWSVDGVDGNSRTEPRRSNRIGVLTFLRTVVG